MMMMRTLNRVASVAPRFARMAVVKVSNEQEYKDAVRNNEHVIAGFFKQGCNNCKQLSPKFEEASNKHSDITFLKLDFEKFGDLSKKCGVESSSMPAIFAINKGKDVDHSLKASEDNLDNLVKGLQASKSEHSSDPSSKTAKSDQNVKADKKQEKDCNSAQSPNASNKTAADKKQDCNSAQSPNASTKKEADKKKKAQTV